ncbi:MAG TPA: arginine--tRNA ligase [Candidatus Acidoferrales bacterium]|nr:arginine--tRNA ligase [Candidatus Acidoferrales bacterium]
MIEQLHRSLQDAVRVAVNKRFGVELDTVVLEKPPQVKLGDAACPVAFELARRLKQSPRDIAGELVKALPAIRGVERAAVAGGGYVNFYFDRGLVFHAATTAGETKLSLSAAAAKVIIEHTNINPNKAAHIGHLRNAVLGDSFVRLLRFAGRRVEVQNYIDNTGVQVADVVVGFQHLEKKTLAQV